MLNMDYKLLALFAGFCFLRFLFPFELPFTANVSLPKWLSIIVVLFRHPFLIIDGHWISVWTVLQGIWIIGIAAKLIYSVYTYVQSHYKIIASSFDVTDSARYQAILEPICKERGKKNNFRILETSGIISPMITGICKPMILLPDHLQFTDKELYYVFLHETAHHFHHDLFIKQCISIITTIYWWNPLCYVLTKKTNIILEMRVDDKVTASDPETICAYLTCLYDLMEQALSVPVPAPLLIGDSVSIDMVQMHNRFEMLTSASRRKHICVNAAALLLVIGLFSWSYLVIYEGDYTPPEIAEKYDTITEAGGYAVIQEDGSYDVYLGKYLLENTDSLASYAEDIPIYTEKEFENEKE